MKYLTFYVRCSFKCEDGSTFGFTFSESCWCMPDAPSTLVGNEVIVFTPEECIERVVRTFFEGLTVREREQAAKTFEFSARQANGLDVLLY